MTHFTFKGAAEYTESDDNDQTRKEVRRGRQQEAIAEDRE